MTRVNSIRIAGIEPFQKKSGESDWRSELKECENRRHSHYPGRIEFPRRGELEIESTGGQELSARALIATALVESGAIGGVISAVMRGMIAGTVSAVLDRVGRARLVYYQTAPPRRMPETKRQQDDG